MKNTECPTLRFILLSCLLVCLVAFKFYGQGEVRASDAGWPRYPHTLTGNIQLHMDFRSTFLASTRSLIVYLPPGYEKDRRRRYPVLYMQDGQNIFDAATSFWPGKERHMDEEAQRLIEQSKVEPLIIVGVYSAGLERLNEYTPTKEAGSNRGGDLELYGLMLVEEIKPFIDTQYRTLSDAAHTGIGGSSLGGLATLYLGLRYQNVFGKIAIISPAAYWDQEMIVRYVRSLPAKTRQHISLSIGTEEPDQFLSSTRNLHETLIDKGWKEGVDLSYLEVAGLEHSPGDQAHRAEHLLKSLFPAK